jgi:hypothetical protein
MCVCVLREVRGVQVVCSMSVLYSIHADKAGAGWAAASRAAGAAVCAAVLVFDGLNPAALQVGGYCVCACMSVY